MRQTKMTATAKRLSREPEICPEALPCPFCGAPAEIEFWHGGRPSKRMLGCGARHDKCAVGPSVTGETKSEAITLWNFRT